MNNKKSYQETKGEERRDPKVAEILVEEGGVVAALHATEIDQQIATAKQFPRSMTKFNASAMEMVTSSEEIAGDCVYALPRGGKTLMGPSARFAEIIAHSYGNCRAGTRVVDIGKKIITAQGIFQDLENNTAITYEVNRRITNKNNKRFDDDMIVVTGNAACSIALRNAVLKGIPKAIWNPIYLGAHKCMAGNEQTLGERRNKLLLAFLQHGIDEDVICEYLGVDGPDDISLTHFKILRPIFTAIKDGDLDPTKAFSRRHSERGKSVGKSSLNDNIPSEPKSEDNMDSAMAENTEEVPFSYDDEKFPG